MKAVFCKCCGIRLIYSKIFFLNNCYEFKEGESIGNYYCYGCMMNKINSHVLENHSNIKLKEEGKITT